MHTHTITPSQGAFSNNFTSQLAQTRLHEHPADGKRSATRKDVRPNESNGGAAEANAGLNNKQPCGTVVRSLIVLFGSCRKMSTFVCMFVCGARYSSYCRRKLQLQLAMTTQSALTLTSAAALLCLRRFDVAGW